MPWLRDSARIGENDDVVVPHTCAGTEPAGIVDVDLPDVVRGHLESAA